MSPRSSAPGRRPPFRVGRPLLSLSLAVLLPGCESLGIPNPLTVFDGSEPGTVVVAMPALPADPLAAFAFSASPGQEGVVPGVGRVRLLRAYAAASGHDCREVSLGYDRASLVCRDATGAVVPTRPLLRGGTLR